MAGGKDVYIARVPCYEISLHAQVKLTWLILAHVKETDKVVACGRCYQFFVAMLPTNRCYLIHKAKVTCTRLVSLQIPNAEAIAADRGYDLGQARVTLDLLHLNLPNGVHFAP